MDLFKQLKQSFCHQLDVGVDKETDLCAVDTFGDRAKAATSTSINCRVEQDTRIHRELESMAQDTSNTCKSMESVKQVHWYAP